MIDSVLTFWFEETEPKTWWTAAPAFDARIRERFLPLLQQAAAGELANWRKQARGRLAEIIVLDQFSRNIHRGTPTAFAQDAMALALSQEALAANALDELDAPQRAFLLMPFMHSESPHIHAQAEALFREHAPDNLKFELQHKAIIDRFGRYPHRNAILGRASTTEETEFLAQPGARF